MPAATVEAEFSCHFPFFVTEIDACEAQGDPHNAFAPGSSRGHWLRSLLPLRETQLKNKGLQCLCFALRIFS